ncbi:aldo/keto reductase [Novosphingobium taihuense]|uniref:Aryl-alcohol dehydrogenase-like predicted oxidoreductase n=1 Tax=Novosphingobium taihuense TaxID=260085 RepID=A0A7W7EUI1_9SPHN|nr:aldo/keto reductase [Novosphingobium taihuense]MBB4613936.1 aryl-alcohol dehydrogenase-like predicted oxidoreductase [Novosphingobium taihuense]TWH86787.1 aryl-alcohol dehydrogenase-like predicted oxidoreductase [Novosphingobium taihuense]
MLSRVTLNNTDLTVSRLCYGTNMLGWMLDQGKANAILDTYAGLGGNFIDTARSYGDWIPDAPVGASERALGAWLKTQKRDDFVIATKGGFYDMRVGDWRNRVTSDDVAADLAQSLDHLGVDTIDLYFLHRDNPESPVEPIIDALIAHREAGRIRHFAASNWSASRISAANAYAASIGKEGFVASETFWGLAVPDTAAAAQQGYQHYYEGEYEDLHACGLPIVAYAAQSGGYFTKLASGSVGEQLAARYANPANERRLSVVQSLAEKHGVSINEIVLSYLLSQPNQTVAIFGGSSPEQVTDSAKADALTLTPEELTALRSA